MLATSPYLLWEERHGGAHVRAITARSGVAAHFTCVMCPKSTPAPAYQRADATMPLALFERIVGQLLYQDEVCLHLFGDPLLDRLIYDRIALVRQHAR